MHRDILEAEAIPEAPHHDKKVWRERYRSINDFERHLDVNGTRVVKLFLHLSKEEQRKRFLDRIDDPSKNWKFSDAGLRYGAVEGALRPPLPTATQSALHDPTILLGLRRPKIGARLTDPSRRNIIAPIRGSERWVAGIKSESRPASDRNRWPASYWNWSPASSESAGCVDNHHPNGGWRPFDPLDRSNSARRISHVGAQLSNDRPRSIQEMDQGLHCQRPRSLSISLANSGPSISDGGKYPSASIGSRCLARLRVPSASQRRQRPGPSALMFCLNA